MVLFSILLLLLLFFVVHDISQGFKFKMSAHFDNDGGFVNIRYLYPFFKVIVSIKENVPYLMVYVLNAELFKKRLVKKVTSKGSASRLLKAAKVTNVDVSTSYGLEDPFATGIVYGAMNLAAAYLPRARIRLLPDFMSSETYVNVNADANFKLGQTIVSYIKNK